MESVSELMFSLFRDTPRDREWMLACLEGAWQGMIGGRLARVCRPAAFRGSSLVIDILEPEWEEALRGVRGDLLERIRAGTGGRVQRITFSGGAEQRRARKDGARPGGRAKK